MIDKLLQRAYKNSKQKGFWRDYENTLAILKGPDSCSICERFDPQNPCIICGPTTHYKNIFISNLLMLISSEVGEAVEALRKENETEFREELADICIRIFDLCGGLEIDLQKEILQKMEKNEKRPPKHGKLF